jgi:hypothetical protein
MSLYAGQEKITLFENAQVTKYPVFVICSPKLITQAFCTFPKIFDFFLLWLSIVLPVHFCTIFLIRLERKGHGQKLL